MVILATTLLLAAFLFPGTLSAQAGLDAYRIHTYAGSDPVLDGGPAVDALLNSPEDVAADAQGVVYIADRRNGLIRRIDPNTGVISSVAGTVTTPGSGTLATELFIDPVAVAISPGGVLHFCTSNQVYRLNADGTADVIAGARSGSGPGDGGPAVEAIFGIISGLTFGPDGSYYVSDFLRNVVRKVGPDGVIERFAGTGPRGFSGDGGQANAAELASPSKIDLDAQGNLYIADRRNNRIRKVAPDGTISTVTGDGRNGVFGLGGPAADGGVGSPLAVTAGPNGSVFVSNFTEVFEIDADGVLNRRIGGAGIAALWGLAAPADGTLLIVDSDHHRVVRAGTDGIVNTIAGKDHLLGDDGPAIEAQLFEPIGIDLDSQGNLYIADNENSAIRRVAVDGGITTVAGGQTLGPHGDGGPALAANLNGAVDAAIHPNGELYVLDGRRRVRKVDSQGVITTFAGGAPFGTTGEGVPADEVDLRFPVDITFDPDGNLYITDLSANTVQKVDTSGIITTVAGNGSRGFSGDGGPAVQAQLESPAAAAMGPDGALYIAGSGRMRKVTPDGAISTLVELPRAATSMSLTPKGDLLIANSSNNWLRRVGLDGSIFDMTRMISGFAGDGGLATGARARNIESAVEHPDGRIFLSDSRNSRIRVLSPFPSIAENGVVHAASFFQGVVAPEMIISLFGSNLALQQRAATSVPLPTTLGGTTVLVRDSQGVERRASLFFVSPGQLNLLIPAGSAFGDAVLILRTDGGDEAEIDVSITSVNPGFFSANSDGKGVAAGTWLHVDGTGGQTAGPLFEPNVGQNRFVATPIDLGPASDRVFLVLFGTGIRGAGGPDRLEATINGEAISIPFADAQPDFFGLDQVNLGPIPRSLIGAGEVEIRIRAKANNFISNIVTVAVK